MKSLDDKMQVQHDDVTQVLPPSTCPQQRLQWRAAAIISFQFAALRRSWA